MDGTKVAADASGHANRSHEEIAREILAEAGRIDAAEDELYGDAAATSCPQELSTRRGRKEWIREALRRQKEEREADPEPVPRGRAERLELCRRRLVDEHRTSVEAHRDYDAAGAPPHRRGRPPRPAEPPAGPEGGVNTTDPDSQEDALPARLPAGLQRPGPRQRHQVVIAAEVLTEGNDSRALAPMVGWPATELGRAGSAERPGIVLADAGYWSADQIDRVREGRRSRWSPPDGRRPGEPPVPTGAGPDGSRGLRQKVRGSVTSRGFRVLLHASAATSSTPSRRSVSQARHRGLTLRNARSASGKCAVPPVRPSRSGCRGFRADHSLPRAATESAARAQPLRPCPTPDPRGGAGRGTSASPRRAVPPGPGRAGRTRRCGPRGGSRPRRRPRGRRTSRGWRSPSSCPPP